MAATRDDEFLLSRVLLAVVSVGFLGVAALALFASSMALDPEDRVPEVAILTPAGIALCGLALAAIGGRVASAVSGVFGAVVAAAASWELTQAGPSGFDSASSAVVALVVLGAAAVGVAAVVVAARDLLSARKNPPATPDSQPRRTRLVGQLTHVLSWLIVGALVAIAAGTGRWYYRSTFITPRCGDLADTQLHTAIRDMARQIPELRITDVSTSCDSTSDAHAQWEHADPTQLVAQARAAGCVVNEQALFNNDEDFLTCTTSSRTVVFTIEIIDVVPLGGSLTMP